MYEGLSGGEVTSRITLLFIGYAVISISVFTIAHAAFSSYKKVMKEAYDKTYPYNWEFDMARNLTTFYLYIPYWILYQLYCIPSRVAVWYAHRKGKDILYERDIQEARDQVELDKNT